MRRRRQDYLRLAAERRRFTLALPFRGATALRAGDFVARLDEAVAARFAGVRAGFLAADARLAGGRAGAFRAAAFREPPEDRERAVPFTGAA